MKAWPEGAILPGTRVRVIQDARWDGPWKREFTGVISPFIAPTQVNHPHAAEGELEYFIVFDEPQIDGEGYGPYVRAVIWSRYLRVEMRSAWAAPAVAPRPRIASTRVFELDMVEPGLEPVFEPEALYRAGLLGGMEADLYTDTAGQVWYFETVPGWAHVSNPVLGATAAGATYVVHPAADGRFAVVLRTDVQARLVEVVAEPLAPVESYGTVGHPLASLLTGGPDWVSTDMLFASLGASTVMGLGRLGERLAEAMGHSQHIGVRLQVFYDGDGAVPAGLRAEWSIDGCPANESFSNA